MGTGTGTHLRPLPGNPDVLAGRQLAALNLGGPFAGVAVGAALLLLALVHADHLAVPRRLAARLHALLAGKKELTQRTRDCSKSTRTPRLSTSFPHQTE